MILSVTTVSSLSFLLAGDSLFSLSLLAFISINTPLTKTGYSAAVTIIKKDDDGVEVPSGLGIRNARRWILPRINLWRGREVHAVQSKHNGCAISVWTSNCKWKSCEWYSPAMWVSVPWEE